ncbi:hypothetical protein B0T26DRAFT_730224 [Lasiosphaeria miniovina]|uniref:Uncharacterized protein n=1 Tax=Lasiosphaeria miniovina TaxID=1954250 RepID=A0AA40DHE3_9PEZI|nr:uncharacterized protein B0T26DRAFT_730224 [Lasiosphaeria miniovina]KAK0703205.1 hypothetical protein B0T26DRAFT_730224 [Lasiosphaeria miniovina]
MAKLVTIVAATRWAVFTFSFSMTPSLTHTVITQTVGESSHQLHVLFSNRRQLTGAAWLSLAAVLSSVLHLLLFNENTPCYGTAELWSVVP